MNIKIQKVSLKEDIDICFDIRKTIFVDGQNVPLQLEIDGKDSESDHYLMMVDGNPCGVTRVRYVKDYAKIERVGILAEYQGKGLGKKLMQYVISDIQKNSNVKAVKLSAQSYAIAFYETLGFHVCSDKYMDAGIPHKDMVLEFWSL